MQWVELTDHFGLAKELSQSLSPLLYLVVEIMMAQTKA